MANSVQVLAKIARNAQQMGMTVNSQSATAVVIENGSNDLTVTYVSASIQGPMGGVDGNVSPFLGIGIASPGKIKIKAAATSAPIDSAVAMKVLAICTRFANNVIVEDSAVTPVAVEIAGHPDLVMMGE